MKQTDFMPRCGLLETYLKGRNLIGAEVGVDVGAHAESILLNCNLFNLYLIDIWDRDFNYGYCVGRLESKGFKHKIEFIRKPSLEAVKSMLFHSLDFIYFDASHEYEDVKDDLFWWQEKLKNDSIIAVRGYSFEGVKKAVDEFLEKTRFKHEKSEYHNEVIIWKGQYDT